MSWLTTITLTIETKIYKSARTNQAARSVR